MESLNHLRISYLQLYLNEEGQIINKGQLSLYI
jgi:hypothetical protein